MGRAQTTYRMPSLDRGVDQVHMEEGMITQREQPSMSLWSSSAKAQQLHVFNPSHAAAPPGPPDARIKIVSPSGHLAPSIVAKESADGVAMYVRASIPVTKARWEVRELDDATMRCGRWSVGVVGGVVVKRRSAEDAAGTEAMCMCVEVWMRTAAVGTLWHLLELIACPGTPTNATAAFISKVPRHELTTACVACLAEAIAFSTKVWPQLGSSNPHTLLERFYFDVSEMLIIFSVAEMRLEQSARFS
ncbi:hypothetical protein BJ912DRAFT_1086739 [Pholiota molesta]|nr:hypothetical protein BJ912DRAFT_1086739 [Pholiota molesta]